MSREHEQLDVDEIERMVARTLVALIDGPHVDSPGVGSLADSREPPSISARLLAERSGLPLRRVREVVELWQLSTVSGEALYLSPDALTHARTLASRPR